MAAKVSKERRYYCSECKQGREGQREPPQLSAQEERRFKIQRCIQILVHATHCRDINCQHFGCAKMKRVVEHMKTCKRKPGGGCRICQELIHLCCYHAKHCLERECVVPFCRHIKLKLRQQKTQQRFARSQTLRRRLATLARQAMQAPPQMPNQAMQPSMTGPGAVEQSLHQHVATIRHQAVQAPPEMPVSQIPPRLVLPGAEGQPHLQQPTIQMTFQEFPHEH